MADTQEQLGDAQLPVFYMKMTTNNVHPRLGKLVPGQVVSLDKDTATRYLTAGVAEQVSSGDYEDARSKRRDKVTAQQQRFRSLNDQYAMWDISTYRDVLSASDAGLRQAYERGIALVNVHLLQDEDGDPLPPDADIEEILEARQSLHSELVAPLTAHDRSSVMGGGSPYTSNVALGPMPLNPGYRDMAERIHRGEQYAQQRAALQDQPDNGGRQPRGGRASRAERRAQTLHGAQGSGQPAISPEAPEQAQTYEIQPPEPPSPGQQA